MSVNRTARTLALAAFLGGCSYTPPPDTAIMPTAGGGTPIMSDDGAAGLAAYVLGNTSLANGHPVDNARAVAAIEYLGGALYSNPHWVSIPSITKLRVLHAREDLRLTYGVAPGASSQAVVSGLLKAADALAGQDQGAASAALPANVFTFGPARTIALLQARPESGTAAVAAQEVNAEMNSPCAFSPLCS